MGERLEIAVNSGDARQQKVGFGSIAGAHLAQFMQGQVEVQLGYLMVYNEDFFIRESRFGMLKGQQGEIDEMARLLAAAQGG